MIEHRMCHSKSGNPTSLTPISLALALSKSLTPLRLWVNILDSVQKTDVHKYSSLPV
jgi:hypothetical protein